MAETVVFQYIIEAEKITAMSAAEKNILFVTCIK